MLRQSWKDAQQLGKGLWPIFPSSKSCDKIISVGCILLVQVRPLSWPAKNKTKQNTPPPRARRGRRGPNLYLFNISAFCPPQPWELYSEEFFGFLYTLREPRAVELGEAKFLTPKSAPFLSKTCPSEKYDFSSICLSLNVICFLLITGHMQLYKEDTKWAKGHLHNYLNGTFNPSH